MMVCKRVIFEGRVQGVGFRYATHALAAQADVRGYVRNLPDGSVELMAEGDTDEVDRFLSAVHRRMATYIGKQTEALVSEQGFTDFRIRH